MFTAANRINTLSAAAHTAASASVSHAVGATVSHTVANRISAVTAAISVTVCIGVAEVMLPAADSGDPVVSESSVVETVESSLDPEPIVIREVIEQDPEVITEVSTVYVPVYVENGQASSSERNYSAYETVVSDDYRFRVYHFSNEAVLLEIRDHSKFDKLWDNY